MVVSTKDFGNVEVAEKDIIFFPHGLYGFKEFKRFALLSEKGKDSFFLWLQCVDSPEPRFVVTDPLRIVKDYHVSPDAVRAVIPLEEEKNMRLLAITTVTTGTKEVYANLKCPVVINARENIAAQIILEKEDYPIRYYIIKRGK
jgi:flagellar assembly factor FliW